MREGESPPSGPVSSKPDADERGKRGIQEDKMQELEASLGGSGFILKHADITDKILYAFFKEVYPELGYGFLEKVYENALVVVLRRMGLDAEQQARIMVHFEDMIVGEYYADLLVEGKVIVEIKAAQRISSEHEAQLLNYLRATPYEVGLILNFGPKPTFVRKAFDHARKVSPTWQTK